MIQQEKKLEELKQGVSYKVLRIVTIALLILLTYLIFFFFKLKIEVFNRTGYDIDSLKVGNKFFQIKKDQSLLITNCKSIWMQSDLPFGLPDAKIRDKKKYTGHIFLCGTGIEEIKYGYHQFDLAVSEDSSFYLIHWQRHKSMTSLNQN